MTENILDRVRRENNELRARLAAVGDRVKNAAVNEVCPLLQEQVAQLVGSDSPALAVVEGFAYNDNGTDPLEWFTTEGWINITPEKDTDYQRKVLVVVLPVGVE